MKTTDQKFEEIIDLIQLTLGDLESDSGHKQQVTQEIIIHSLIWGSQNSFEALGILEHCKEEYKNLINNLED